MHMADALISPAVGGAMWVATGAVTAYCAKKVRDDPDQSKIPLMGVLGAFIFAAQMLNFTIPATGSSGHLGGGLILAVLLGPYAAFLVIASVLTVQALFFADGGLLALGCNIFNLGFFPAFIAYPFVYKKIVGHSHSPGRIFAGSIAGAIVGLQLGALGVVLETTASGISDLPFNTFVWMMQPIHLAIGVVEGLVTAAVVLFVQRTRPEILERNAEGRSLAGLKLKPVLIGMAIAAVACGAAFSWFASNNADGLEWSIAKVTGGAELEGGSAGAHAAAASVQEKTAFLPDYGFKQSEPAADEAAEPAGDKAAYESASPAWPAVSAGTSVAGLVGAGLTMMIAVLLGFVLTRRRSSKIAGDRV
jgi:cobalt/nickel transport system permease protein